MELSEFVAAVQGFGSLSQPDQILHFMWYLHKHEKRDVIGQAMIRECFKKRHMDEPDLSKIFQRLRVRRPKVVLEAGHGIKLEAKIRDDFDKKYGQHETTIAVSQMLKDLIGKVSDEAERLFLSEANKCYHVKAFRAAIVMAWNLAYDHLLKWIIADPQRLSDFNSKIIAKIGTRRGTGVVIEDRLDFEQLGEQEVLDICSNAGLFPSNNTKTILDIQLKKRNMAAHPSLVVMDGPQADDTISSLVNNVVLVLV
jgi:hypothetical protein